eukprot:m.83466 g.83466  ORF g.83466 m.83466 type:complete len:588 (+) comp9539_c0_seq2:204-1967(+)
MSHMARGRARVCVACSRDVSTDVHIACAVCANCNMCVGCFSTGFEQGTHRNTHPYKVIDNMRFSVTEPSWRADEELRLLDALGKLGMGNWDPVAAQVGTKSATECERHYTQCYLQSKTAPLPDLHRGSGTDDGWNRNDNGAGPAVTSSAWADASTNGDVSGAAAGTGKTGPTGPPTGQGRGSENDNLPPVALPFQYAGFYPKRGDFEQEHCEGAESLMAGITFYDDDSPLDRRLKLTMLRIYNSKLRERRERKQFVIDRGLVGDTKLKRFRDNKDFRNVFEKIRPFVRMHPKEGMWDLLEAIHDRVVLTRKVRHFQELRRAGLTKLRQEAQLAKDYRKSAHVAARAGATGASASTASGGGPSGGGGTGSGSGGGGGSANGTGGGRITPVLHTSSSSSSRKGGAAATASFDALKALDGASTLSGAELELCHTNAILPSQYNRLKATLLVEFDRRGVLAFADACNVSLLRAAKTAAVYAHLLTSGWIKAPPQTAASGNAKGHPGAYVVGSVGVRGGRASTQHQHPHHPTVAARSGPAAASGAVKTTTTAPPQAMGTAAGASATVPAQWKGRSKAHENGSTTDLEPMLFG